MTSLRPHYREGGAMPKKGKKAVDAAKRFDGQQTYGPAEALELVKSLAHAKFDETVEIAVRLGVDPRKADQVIRGTVSLPAGTGKEVRVAVFAAGAAAEAARAAGADIVGAEDLVAQVDGGMMDFDVAIATPDLMGQVGRLGRKLGPRGLMPNPKTGTVTMDVGKAVSDFKGGRVEYRADARSRGVLQVPIGKVSFTQAQLLTNFRAVVEEVNRVKPAAAKGKYVRSLAVSSTMGPGVDVDVNTLRITDEDLAAVS
jgi:large subunit ribosomal protein L1